jgi:hypothetical protein
MKIKTLITLLLISFQTLTLFGQTPNLLGKWDFHKLETKKEIDEEGKEIMNRMFTNMSYQFNTDNTYNIKMRKKTEVGKWELNGNTISTTNENGLISKIKFVLKSNDTLKIEMDKNEYLVLLKDKNYKEETEPKAEPKQTIKTVSVANETLLCKKWYLIKKIKPNRTEEQLKLVSDVLKGSYFEFYNNGKFKIEMLKIVEKGTWALNNNKSEIIQTKSDDTSVIWKILKISEDELLINLGDSNEQLLLSTKI